MKERHFHVQINRIIKTRSKENYTNFRGSKHLSNGYLIRNSLKQEKTLQTLVQLHCRMGH
jgi:hypothetical protein